LPHFHIEYSGNLEAALDMQSFCEEIRRIGAEIEAFPMPGIRVRAVKVDHYAIADGNPKHGFVDITVRLRAGRPDDIKKDAAKRIFDAANAFLEPVMKTCSLALSLELRDIDPDFSLKTGSIRNHLETGS
jgi:5-carboxymethyl-2-hydroxymuconate isomerase